MRDIRGERYKELKIQEVEDKYKEIGSGRHRIWETKRVGDVGSGTHRGWETE